MKYTRKIAIGLTLAIGSGTTAAAQQFIHVSAPEPTQEVVQDTIKPLMGAELLESIVIQDTTNNSLNRVLGPWIFSGYRHVAPKHTFKVGDAMTREDIWRKAAFYAENPDADSLSVRLAMHDIEQLEMLNDMKRDPVWLRNVIKAQNMQDDFIYTMIIDDYKRADVAYWDLPVPPTIPEEDMSYVGYVSRLNLPAIDTSKANLPELETEKRHWLHIFNTGLQFSQAYLSKNWYQGGNNYLALLFNFMWDVSLNQVYHPNLMFQSVLSYKLGLNSVEDDIYHKYSISQDNFQYNMKAGVKAFRNWFYSFTLQFKTQLLNNYPKNSQIQTASFLSPGDLTAGLGMTYNKNNASKSLQFSASISPISYNLRMCIDPAVDHAPLNIPPDRKFSNQIGSNAELTFKAVISSSVSYNTRLFLFSDYKYFMGDWENTFNFQFSRFFSTQLYFNLRYDSSIDPAVAPGWKCWMLKEILSVGFSYTFNTKS